MLHCFELECFAAPGGSLSFSGIRSCRNLALFEQLAVLWMFWWKGCGCFGGKVVDCC